MGLKKRSKRLEQVVLGKLTKRGQRGHGEKILHSCLEGLGSPKEFEEAVERLVPLIDLKSKKVSGTFYRIPIYLERRKGVSKGINLLLEMLRSRKGVPMEVKLKEELMLARKGQGKAVGRLEELYESGRKNRGLVKFL